MQSISCCFNVGTESMASILDLLLRFCLSLILALEIMTFGLLKLAASGPLTRLSRSGDDKGHTLIAFMSSSGVWQWVLSAILSSSIVEFFSHWSGSFLFFRFNTLKKLFPKRPFWLQSPGPFPDIFGGGPFSTEDALERLQFCPPFHPSSRILSFSSWVSASPLKDGPSLSASFAFYIYIYIYLCLPCVMVSQLNTLFYSKF